MFLQELLNSVTVPAVKIKICLTAVHVIMRKCFFHRKTSYLTHLNDSVFREVEDSLTDELHIYICDQDHQSDVKQEKHSAVKQ